MAIFTHVLVSGRETLVCGIGTLNGYMYSAG